jgi:hypothetical protein
MKCNCRIPVPARRAGVRRVAREQNAVPAVRRRLWQIEEETE